MWPWIIAYDLWNHAYLYNSLADYTWYCTLALLLACTIPAFTWAKGSRILVLAASPSCSGLPSTIGYPACRHRQARCPNMPPWIPTRTLCACVCGAYLQRGRVHLLAVQDH
ncbi:MAG: DUF5692 family protein [Lawsonella clevelandensis]